MRQLPRPPSPNERALAQHYQEQFTGLTTASLSLSYVVAQTQDGVSLILLYKNGSLLSQGGGASQYTVTGKAVTLGTAAINTDNFVVSYQYRT